MSRQFSDILNECIEQLLKGESIEDCLGRYPEYADELEPLLQVARITADAAIVQPPAEFRAAARERLMARVASRAAVNGATPRIPIVFQLWHGLLRLVDPIRAGDAHRGNHRTRFLAAGAALIAFIFVSSGAVVASAASVPGDPLYGVKLAQEQVRLAVATSDVEKANIHAELADRRLDEVEVLLTRRGQVDIEVVNAAIRERELASQLAAKGTTANADIVRERVQELAPRAEQVLEKARSKAPESAQAGLERALESIKRDDAQKQNGKAKNNPEPANNRPAATDVPSNAAKPEKSNTGNRQKPTNVPSDAAAVPTSEPSVATATPTREAPTATVTPTGASSAVDTTPTPTPDRGNASGKPGANATVTDTPEPTATPTATEVSEPTATATANETTEPIGTKPPNSTTELTLTPTGTEPRGRGGPNNRSTPQSIDDTDSDQIETNETMTPTPSPTRTPDPTTLRSPSSVPTKSPDQRFKSRFYGPGPSDDVSGTPTSGSWQPTSTTY